MHRFFVSPDLLKEIGAIVSLPKELAHQVRDVLRLAAGERLVLLDNSGDEVLAALDKSSQAGVAVQLVERQAGKSESPVRIILCQGLLKSARFEWILEKGTESGVAVFAPTRALACSPALAYPQRSSPACAHHHAMGRGTQPSPTACVGLRYRQERCSAIHNGCRVGLASCYSSALYRSRGRVYG